MRITVLSGGISTERSVSLASGARIANALIRLGHEVALLDLCAPVLQKPKKLFRRGTLFAEPAPETLARITVPASTARPVGEGVLNVCAASDMTFLALHGGAGEDGRLQALLELNAIPFTGSSHAACALAMNKYLSKTVLQASSLAVPAGVLLAKGETPSLPFPLVIKPCSLGSSVGVAVAENETALAAALAKARQYNAPVLAEEKIEGREFSCGVLGETVLPPIEIRLPGGFYDTVGKYTQGKAAELCPAPLSAEQTLRLQKAAQTAHRALGLEVYSRADFILDNKTGEFVCLEVNTLPGMTACSLFPQEAAAAGISYEKLVEKILLLSLDRFRKTA